MIPSKSSNKCYRTGFVKKPLLAEAGCLEDFAAVSALPDEWTPRSCGPILTNYLKDRERKHEMVLKDLTEHAALANKEIDNKVRFLAKNSLSEIERNDNDIKCVIKRFQPSGGSLSVEDRNEALKQISKLFKIRTKEIVIFKQEGTSLERERAESLKHVLKDKNFRLIGVGHKTPKSLLHEFDEKIYEINQQLLSNTRAYIELEYQLRTQLDHRIVHARSSLNQLCISSSKMERRRTVLPWSRSDKFCEGFFKSVSSENRQNISDITSGILLDLEEFKKCVSVIVDAYRNAILKVYKRFTGQLDILHQNIGVQKFMTQIIDSDFDLEKMIDRAFRYIAHSSLKCEQFFSQDLEEITKNDVMNMQKSLVSLSERLKDTYIILYHAGHLWDAHIMRSALVQKLRLATVEDTQMVNDAIELANEVNFNIVLEQLLCASELDKLQQQFDIAMNLINQTSDMYQQHSEIEINKLEDFMNLIPFMSNVLLSECDCFLEKYSTLAMESSSSLKSSLGSGSNYLQPMFYLRASLPRAIFQTQLQEKALNNWRNGFIESFKDNLSAIPEELTRHARKWVDDKCLQLNMRHSLKLVSHSIRSERVKKSREARLAEIKLHDLRLNSHLKAVFDLIDRLPLEATEYFNINNTNLYPLPSWIKTIETGISELLARDPLDLEVKRLKMSSYALRLIKHRKHFEESLDEVINKYTNEFEYNIQIVRISNLNFMKQLKLFNEGGRYSASEALKSCGALVRAAEALESCVHDTMEALNQRRTKLLALADQLIMPVQQAVDEVCKYGTKTIISKRKSASKKKT